MLLLVITVLVGTLSFPPSIPPGFDREGVDSWRKHTPGDVPCIYDGRYEEPAPKPYEAPSHCVI